VRLPGHLFFVYEAGWSTPPVVISVLSRRGEHGRREDVLWGKQGVVAQGARTPVVVPTGANSSIGICEILANGYHAELALVGGATKSYSFAPSASMSAGVFNRLIPFTCSSSSKNVVVEINRGPIAFELVARRRCHTNSPADHQRVTSMTTSAETLESSVHKHCS
jgi:hypothetical protein